MDWIEFTVGATLIIIAGIKLTRYADVISDRLSLGKVWIGIVILGLVTSLPEAITSLVSIISLSAYDLAIGNLVGSNNFNPMLLVVMDIIYRKGPVTNAISPDKSHRVSAMLAVMLSVIVIMEIFFSIHSPWPHWGPLSVGSLLIAICYFFGMRYLSVLGKNASSGIETHEPSNNQQEPMNRIIFKLLMCSVLVIVGAIWLANSADRIAVQTGLGRTFVGSIFLAFVTSLPEMVVTISALKMRAFDLAIGNIFGSNMTNLFIIFISTFFTKAGPVLSLVSQTHIVTLILSMILTGLAIWGIHHRGKKSFGGLGWDTIAMTFCFITGTFLLYKIR